MRNFFLLIVFLAFAAFFTYIYVFRAPMISFGFSKNPESEISTLQDLVREYKQRLNFGQNTDCQTGFPLLISYDITLHDSQVKVYSNCQSENGITESNMVQQIVFSNQFLSKNFPQNPEIVFNIASQVTSQNNSEFLFRSLTKCLEYRLNANGIIKLNKIYSASCTND